jgi:tetratricopeptide (TPR) repeat protein
MSPEQAEGDTQRVGPATDIYALGVVLYEMLTGRVPFKSATLLQTLEQVRVREPVAPGELVDRLPRDLETICLKCLHKDPKRRYASAAALADDLRRFLAGEPILARPVSRAERLWRWCRRHPWPAALGAATACVVVAWAVTMSVLGWRLEREKTEAENARRLADEQRQVALENARMARAWEKTGNDQFDKTTRHLEFLSTEMLNKLRAPAMRTRPEVRNLAEGVLVIFKQHMLDMAAELQAPAGSSFGNAVAYQRIGDVLLRLGKVDEARRYFQKGYEHARRQAEEHTDSDKARANVGVLLLRLGKLEQELRGDARAAREYFRRALELRQEIAEHPQSGDYDDLDNALALSHDELALGKAELELGNPQAAREHFRKAVQLRRTWSQAKPQLEEGRSWLTEGLMWCGTAASHLEDAAGVEEALGEALRLCRDLVAKFPAAFWYKADLAEVYGNQGDARLRLGQPSEAEKWYALSLTNIRIGLDNVPEEAAWKVVLAQTEERLAWVTALRGAAQEAQKHDREALRVRGELLEVEPENWTWQAAHARSLARCGKEAEAVRAAEALLKKNPQSTPLQLEAARCYAACAARAAPPGQQRYRASAIAAVRVATAAGYQDRTALRTDPDLAALQGDPDYQALLRAAAPR